MNERDKALGRLLLARNQVARETLHQAAATTEARRAAGQQVEVVAVLVEMGALQTDAARAVWAEVAHVAPVPGGPPSGTFQRPSQPPSGAFQRPQAPIQPAQPSFRAATPHAGVPTRPSFPTGQRMAAGPMLSGEGDFSPVSTLSTMGEAPPQVPRGHDPLRSSRTMAAVPPGGPAHLPPARPFGGPSPGTPPGTFPPGAFLASPGKDTILDPSPATPSFGPAPSFGPNGANGARGPVFGGSSGFGGGYSSAPVPLPPQQDLAAPFDPAGLPPGATAGLGPSPFPAPGFASYPAPIGTPVAPAALGPAIQLGGGDAPASPSPDGKKKKGTSARLGGQARKTKLGPAPAKAGSNTTLILGGAACVAFLIVAGVAFALGGDKAGGRKDGPAATVSDAEAPSLQVTRPAGGEPATEPTPDPTTEPARPRPRPQSEQGQRSLGLQSTPIQAEQDDASHRWADQVLAEAAILQDKEQYEEGVAALDKFPETMRTGEGFARVQRLRARLELYAGFKRRLDEALQEGPTSMKLKKLVARLEGGTIEEEVKMLPCVARFEDDARRVLGDAAYNEIAVKAVDFDDLEEKE